MAVKELKSYVVVCDFCQKEVFKTKFVQEFEKPEEDDYLTKHSEFRYPSFRDYFLCESCFEKREIY